MLSREDLMRRPQRRQPLGSIKGTVDTLSEKPFARVDMNDLFLSKANGQLLVDTFFRYHRDQGGRSKKSVVKRFILSLMKSFCGGQDLNRYVTTDSQATRQVNWVEVLKTVNGIFLGQAKNHIAHNAMVPTRQMTMVGPSGRRVMKKYSELTAADIPTVNVWAPQEVRRVDSQFRYGNSIPVWQRSMHARHYDRGNEGLRHDDSARSSLETPVYGYEMGDIHALHNRWDDTEWFGLN